MKSTARLIIISAVLLSLSLTGCNFQKYQVDLDPTKRFELAKAREAQSPIAAIEEYSNISREYSNGDAKSTSDTLKFRETAGEALFRASEFGYAQIDPAKLNVAGMNPVAKTEMESLQFQIGDKAHAAMKELVYQLGDTPAAKRAAEPRFGDSKNMTLREALEHRIDTRNMQLLSYKIIQGFVNLTGAIPILSYWFALLLIAVFVKLVTLPLMLKTYKSQREMAKMQPILKEIQTKHKDDRVVMNQKVMEAYKEHGVNPLAGCLPMFVQLPFLWWVYTAIRYFEFHFSNGQFLWITPSLAGRFPGIVAGNLGQFDLILTIIYAGSNFLTMRLTPASDPQQAQTQKQMSVMMTFMMFYMFLIYKWSSAFTLYWLMTNLISAWQSYHFIYKPNKLEAAAKAAQTIDIKAIPDSGAKTAPKTATSNAGGGSGSGKNKKRR